MPINISSYEKGKPYERMGRKTAGPVMKGWRGYPTAKLDIKAHSSIERMGFLFGDMDARLKVRSII